MTATEDAIEFSQIPDEVWVKIVLEMTWFLKGYLADKRITKSSLNFYCQIAGLEWRAK